jgi:hypothetical protein
MTVDTKRLREFALAHQGELGLRPEHLAEWRLNCPPGAVVELIDEVERRRREGSNQTNRMGQLADGIGQLDADYRKAREDLGEMTYARNMACRIAMVALGRLAHIEHPADWQSDMDSIGELRKVGG